MLRSNSTCSPGALTGRILNLLGDMRSFGVNIDGVERLARNHEQPVSLFTPKTQIRANLRQHNHTNPLSIGCEDMHTVVAGADPAGGGPDVAISVSADSI